MKFLKNLAKNKKGSAFIETLIIYVAVFAIGTAVVAALWKFVADAGKPNATPGDHSSDLTQK